MLLTLLCTAALVSPLHAAPQTAPASAIPASVQRGGATAQQAAGAATDCEQIELKTSDGLTLHGAFYAARGGARGQRVPAALLVHDAGSNQADLAPLAQRLQKQGMAVLAIDLRGHGASASSGQAWTSLDADAQQRQWALSTRDVEAAARWLSARSEVHASSLNVIGLRAGCTLVVRHATRDENVRSLVLIEPEAKQLGFDLRGDLKGLEGVPTLIAAAKERKQIAIEIAGPGAGEGRGSVEISVARVVQEGPLEDKKGVAELAKWVQDKASPKRGQ
jgi:dienelactone hydrolase